MNVTRHFWFVNLAKNFWRGRFFIMKKIFGYYALILGILFLPSIVSAQVVINEIAWMGTDKNSSDEWVEFYNNSSSTVSLKNWTLNGIALGGSIAGGGYYLVAFDKGQDTIQYERSDVSDASVSASGSDNLSNDGEEIILKEGTRAIKTVDLNDNGKWKAGSNETDNTMTWDGTKWITAKPTPGKENSTKDLSTESDGENSDGDEESSSSDNNSNSNTSDDDEISSHSSSVPIKDFDPIYEIITEAGRERIGVVGAPLQFTAKTMTPEEKVVENADYSWTFGDGYTADGEDVEHRYAFPGTYNVVLHAEYKVHKAIDRTSVTIAPLDVIISNIKTGDDGFVELTNEGDEEVNIGAYELESGEVSFEFPKDTIIDPGSSIKFSNALLGFSSESNVGLVYPDGELVSSWEEADGGEVLGARVSHIEMELEKSKEKLAALLIKKSQVKKVLKTHTLQKKYESKTQKTASVPHKERSEKMRQEGILNANHEKSSKESEHVIVVREPKSWWDKFWGSFF